jgi:hypothetical protein
VGATLALLGCVGLAVSSARALTWEADEPASAGSCVVSAIAVDYAVDYVPAIGGYGVTAASLSGVPEGCEGREIALTLHDGADQALAEARTAVTSPTTTVDLTAGAVSAAEVTGVSVALVTDAGA